MLVFLLFILGFFVLVKGAFLLVEGATSIAKKLKVSDLIIGLTIVAFGTSAPELLINIFATGFEEADLAFANIFGSNLVNTLLILGVASLIYPLAISKNAVWRGIPFLLGVTVVVGILINDFFIDKAASSTLTKADGLVLLFLFAVFIFYNFREVKANSDSGANISLVRGKEIEKEEFSFLKSILLIILGVIGLTLGGKWIVSGAIQLADFLGLSKFFIGLTIVAIGTSLPELATSIVAARKRKADIVVGSIIGSSIFNLLWVLGISALIKPLTFQIAGNIDLGMVIFSSFLLFAFMFVGKKHILERWQGASLIIVYLSYLIFTIIRG